MARGGGMNKVQAEEGADRLDDHLDTFRDDHPGFEKHFAGQLDADVCIAVVPSNHGQSMQSVIDIVNFYEPYDSELAQRTGWKLDVTLCKHWKDLDLWTQFNNEVLLGMGSIRRVAKNGLQLSLFNEKAYVLLSKLAPHMTNRWAQAQEVLDKYRVWANMGGSITPKPVIVRYPRYGGGGYDEIIYSAQHEVARRYRIKQPTISLSFTRAKKRNNEGDRLSNPITLKPTATAEDPRTSVKATLVEREWTEERYDENWWHHADLTNFVHNCKWDEPHPLPPNLAERVRVQQEVDGYYAGDGSEYLGLSLTAAARAAKKTLWELEPADLTNSICNPNIRINQKKRRPLLDIAIAEGCPPEGGNSGDGCAFYGPYQTTNKETGVTYTIHTLEWSGARALAKARAWHAAAVAGGWVHLHEKRRNLELLIEWADCAGLPLQQRKAEALRIERALREIHA